MILKACHECPYHTITNNDGEKERSFCRKEYCFSEFTKCIDKKALERFFDQEGTKNPVQCSMLNREHTTNIQCRILK
jgi:hypothetical protein